MHAHARWVVVDRVQTTSSVEMRLDGVCSSHDLSFLTLSGFDPTSSLPKREFTARPCNQLLTEDDQGSEDDIKRAVRSRLDLSLYPLLDCHS